MSSTSLYLSVYSKGRECPGSEKTALNKQREELVKDFFFGFASAINPVFEALAKQKKNISDHGYSKHRSVYSKGRECPGSEKTTLNVR